MSELVLSQATQRAVDSFVEKPSHAVLITAPAGAGKRSLALELAARLLQVEKLDNQPYFKHVTLTNMKSISVEAVRDVIKFLSLKTTGKSAINRMVIIENAQLMTPQAQNALLKTIEEPPAGTVLILTAPGELGILPTIRSRVQIL